jgi:YhcH/YjgK/YiaL family protein
MIIDTFSQFQRYSSLSPRFATALEFLKKLPPDKAAGRYELDGDNCIALVQSYTTKPHALATFETHQRYIDIQFIQSGVETMLWAPRSSLQVSQDYVPEKDVTLYAMPAQSVAVNVRAGEFTIFFPEDGHAPALACGNPCEVRKVVIKVRV